MSKLAFYKLPPTPSGSFDDISSKYSFRHFVFGLLLILTLAANFADSSKPKVYFEVKILTLQFGFEGKAETGEAKVRSFGFDVNLLF